MQAMLKFLQLRSLSTDTLILLAIDEDFAQVLQGLIIKQTVSFEEKKMVFAPAQSSDRPQ